MATRGPRGSGCIPARAETSASWRRSSTRMMLAARHRASTAASSSAAAAVWLLAAAAAAAVRPAFSRTIGLIRLARPASRANGRGSAIDSRYAAITRVPFVGLPPWQHVVAADVGLVADRHQARDTSASVLERIEHGDGGRAGLRQDRGGTDR